MSGRDSFPVDGMVGSYKQDELPPLSSAAASEELLNGRHLQVQCTVIPTGKKNDGVSPTLSTVRLEVPLASSVCIKPSTEHALHVPKRRMSNKWTQQSELQKIIEHKSPNVSSVLNNNNEDSHDQRVASEYQAYTVRMPPPGECTRSMSLSGYNPTVLSDYKLMKDVEEESQGLVKCIPEKREILPVLGHKKAADVIPSGVGEEEVTGYLLPKMDQLVSWKKIKLIGRGNFSDVYVYESSDVSLPPTYRTVAVKSIRYPSELIKTNSRNTPKGIEMLSRLESSLTRELIVLQTLDHPCIVKLYGINDQEFLNGEHPLTSRITEELLPPCNLIMSYCSGGDLLELAKTHKLPDWLLQRIVVELSHAVKYLHDNYVIHRDIKLENVLIKYQWEQLISMKSCYDCSIIELADFGLCRQVQPGELCNARCGSEDYVAPEILMGLSYDGRLCDTWAIGVLLYALLEDRLPFDLIPSHIHRRGRTRSTAHRIARLEWRWLVLASLEHPAKEIVNHCLVSRQNRWKIDDIIGSTYVSDLTSKLAFLQASASEP